MRSWPGQLSCLAQIVTVIMKRSGAVPRMIGILASKIWLRFW